MKIINSEYDANSKPISITVEDDGKIFEFIAQRTGEWVQDGIYDRCTSCNKLTIMPHLKGLPYHDFCPRCGSLNTKKSIR